MEKGPYFHVAGIVRLDVLVASACGSATTQSSAVKVRLACCPRVCGSHDWFDPGPGASSQACMECRMPAVAAADTHTDVTRGVSGALGYRCRLSLS